MTFEFSTLEPQIHQILSAPGTDLATISAKRVRRQLLEADPSLTPEFLKENKEDVDLVIGRVFEKVSKGVNVGGSEEVEDLETEQGSEGSRKRKQDYDSGNGDEEEDDEVEDGTPSPKKAKKARKKELSDAELARKLSNEINGRSRRTTNKGRSSINGTPKRGGRARKSAATVDSDDESSGDDRGKKPSKRKSGRGGGAAKGGFAKEYSLRYRSLTKLNQTRR
jgi:upstream activation factor subunit UAF30